MGTYYYGRDGYGEYHHRTSKLGEEGAVKCSFLHSAEDGVRMIDYERDGKGIADAVMEKHGMTNWLENR